MNVRAEIGALAKVFYASLLIILAILAAFEKAGDTPIDTASRIYQIIESKVTYSTEQSVEKIETKSIAAPKVIVAKADLPRGVRNNNPLNLRVGNNWQGELSVNTDGSFEQFESSAYGFRAAAKVIRTYQSKYGLKTINDIVTRFAPPVENNTKNYASFVAGKMGIDLHKPINLLYDDALLAELLHYMSIMEVGQHYSYTDAFIGVSLASGKSLES